MQFGVTYRTFLNWLVLLVCLPLAGCGTEFKVRNEPPDEMELFSLVGVRFRPGIDPVDPEYQDYELFHGAPILGSENITDPKQRAKLWDSLHQGIETGFEGPLPACFNPRHGLRVRSQGIETDYLICFECAQYVIYPDDPKSYLPIGNQAESLFNQTLTAAGIPLAPHSGEDAVE